MVGPNSWLLFNLLDDDGAWLALPPDQWERSLSYQRMSKFVQYLAVVNDAAERGVKDVQDYANAAGDGSYREQIVLVANSHRAKLPSFLKNEMEEHL